MKKIMIIFFLIFVVISKTNSVKAEDNIDFEDLFDNHQSVMLIIHPITGVIFYANQAAVDFYGYDVDQLIGMNINDINMLTPEEVAAERQRAANEERNFFVFRHQLADGDIRTVHVYSYPVQIQGEQYLFSIIIDQTVLAASEARNRVLNIVLISLTSITAISTTLFLVVLWQKNRRIQESEERFRILHNASFGGVFIHDQGTILDCNQGLSDLTGYSVDELIGMNVLELIDKEDHAKVWENITTGYEKAYNITGVKKIGEKYPMTAEARNMPYKGKILRTVEFKDLTELRKSQDELKEVKERLELVMDNMPIGIAVNSVDPSVNFSYMNDNFPKIYGVTKDVLEKEDGFWEAVYENPVFREELKKKVLSDIASNDPKKMQWLDIPIEKEGKPTRYINAYATRIHNSNLLISTVIDVTDRKTIENEIVRVSKYDYLTGLPNRHYFDEKKKQFDQPENYPLLIVMIDIDGLKLINDAYGDKIGNQALKRVASVLKDYCKDLEFVSRTGGDEFIILSPKTTKEEFIQRNNFFAKISNIKIKDIQLSLSFGVQVKKSQSEAIDDVIRRAENDMYANKVLHGQSSRNQTIMAIFDTLKDKYDEEREHSDRVSLYCSMMGEKLNLSHTEKLELELAGRLHDIGKITIPDSILKKPAKLNDEEWAVMKTHTTNGYQILKSADHYSVLAEYALTHHERIDGKGYPQGLEGNEIPLYSKIIAIADAYEAMTADRPYRKALSKEEAINELRRCSGTQFDAELVNVFITKVLVH